MISQGSNNQVFGQFQEFKYIMENNIKMNFNNNEIQFVDSNDLPLVKMFIDSGLIKYQMYVEGAWQPAQSITNPVINPLDSVTLPINPNNTRIVIDNNEFQIYLAGILKHKLTSTDLMYQVNTFTIDNQVSDLVFKFKSLLGQNIQFKDYDTNTDLLTLNGQSLNICQKPIIGIVPSTDQQSAVNLQQLEQFQSNSLKMSGIDNNIKMFNSSEIPVLTINTSTINSQKPFIYDTRPIIFGQTTLTDQQHVNDMLTDYQQLSQKDQLNGYAGLSSSGKLNSDELPGQTVLLNTTNKLSNYSGTSIQSDMIDEGVNHLYFTETRVNNSINQQKGIINGLTPLDSTNKIPQIYLPNLPVGNRFSGLDTNKTNPITYPTNTPIIGDQYISTDTGTISVLVDLPYTNTINWILLDLGGVTQVNGQTGIVSLNSDNIPESITNKYFNSGINEYITNHSNTANNLLQLDSNGLIDQNQLNNNFILNNGSIIIQDNQSDSMIFANSSNNSEILNIQHNLITSKKPVRYDNVTISDNNDLTNKIYVDTSIASYIPDKIQNTSTFLETTSSSINIDVQGNNTVQMLQSQTTSLVPLLYDSGVQVTQDQQLATKQYVDSKLSDFINNTGINKEYIQAISNNPITTNGRITGWNPTVQSSTLDRMTFNINDTFTITQGVYRFYLGVQLNEFTEQGLVQISVKIRDSDTQQEYFYFDFYNNISSIGGEQSLTMAYPYIWSFSGSTNIEVFVSSNDVSYGVYKSYIMIEEFEKHEFLIGRDRITDPTNVSKVQVTDQYIDFNVNNTDYAKFTNNSLVLQPNIVAQYDIGTNFLNNQLNLVTKGYVDSKVDLATVSITNLGQLMSTQLTSNQQSGLQSGGTILMNQIVVNTSQTMNVNLSGIYTFTHGFIYRVQYQISCRFISNTGFLIIGFKKITDQSIVTNSNAYIALSSSSTDTPIGTACFYIDLRTEISPIQYTLSVISSMNAFQIYKAYSSISAEQIQQINDQLYDRIQNLNAVTRLLIDQNQIQFKINGDLIEIISNDTQNVVRSLQFNNKNIYLQSTPLSSNITQKTILTNTDNTNQRNAIIESSVNDELTTQLVSEITDLVSSNNKISKLVGFNADQLQLYAGTTTNQPDITIYNQNLALPIPIVVNSVMGYNSSINITENHQFATKQYVDDHSGGSTQIINNINTNSKLVANQYELTNGTTNLNMNSSKITNLSNASSDNDALNRISADNRFYMNNVTLDAITLPIASVSLNSQKITNLLDATLNTDALNRQSADSRFYANSTTLNNITLPNASVSMNSQKITNLANATTSTDALNRQTADSRFYQQNVTLDTIAIPIASVSLNSQKITNLSDPTLNQDASTKAYTDTKLSLTGGTMTGAIALGTNKITGLGNATSDNDALNRISGDNRFYQQTATLATIAIPVGSVNLNSQKITNLLTCTNGNDAANKTYVDSVVLVASSGFSVVKVTTSSTISIPSGYSRCKIIGQAAGGGGQYAQNSQQINGIYAPTAGAGGAFIKYLGNLSSTNNTIQIVIGQGGLASITAGINTNTNGENTTVSLLLSGVLNQGPFIAYGGLKGILLPISTDPIIEASAGGSSSSNVDEQLDGEDGHHGYFVNTISVAQSTVRGASSYLGRGGPSLYKYQFGTLINGVSGTGYGSTGSGGSSGGLSTNGQPGVVIVTFF